MRAGLGSPTVEISQKLKLPVDCQRWICLSVPGSHHQVPLTLQFPHLSSRVQVCSVQGLSRAFVKGRLHILHITVSLC